MAFQLYHGSDRHLHETTTIIEKHISPHEAWSYLARYCMSASVKLDVYRGTRWMRNYYNEGFFTFVGISTDGSVVAIENRGGEFLLITVSCEDFKTYYKFVTHYCPVYDNLPRISI